MACFLIPPCLSLFYAIEELKNEWPLVESAFQKHGMSCKLNLDEGTLTVATTPMTRGADIINKTMDLLVLLALLPVPPSAAVDILSGKRLYDIIWTCDSNGGLASQLPLRSRMRYFSRMRKLRRSIKDLMCLTGCPIFYNLGICVALFGHQPRSLVLVRNVVSSCIFYNQDPATIIRLKTLGRQRNAQSTVNLEMDAYGFETAPGVDITFCIANYMSKAPVLEHQKLERVKKKYLFGPSVNKDGMFVCGSYFLKKREQDVVEAWPMLKSVLEEYGITCTMYQVCPQCMRTIMFDHFNME
uniref:KRR1 small subunit processome component homolog isoform X1 n=1 Tax=Fragaria vesca subsp. vesca TaxID=101020 RepID=UPI0005C9208E|nr:PREDICTED: KRR1 small subunit processome component homolog isoform X1 [Fragaria vesca subsp. vesca]XP_011458222.1 PREDICTED: KRR1 small subunit processome component homolog isoform X1 [Fragaria vesca subsp. vesca]XP_011458223.1 PREDICTED: KRR1 small subunit processome component homolog isoform X1 [Fragaria vesca subsp. vesca]XP_011458224.1 PREDICTED: KRR1 small subunit processome component homolog isoform X1 [Fragaria vesca subsp. vesca]